MSDVLTKDDRSNAMRCAARFAHGMYHGPGKQPWVRDGKMTGVTEDMLTHLLAEVYSIGFDSGRAVQLDTCAHPDFHLCSNCVERIRAAIGALTSSSPR